jgi:hypothetical protein
MIERRNVLASFGALSLLALSGCIYGPGHGPPAHAPAWGRRRKMVYDPVLGVHVVSGMAGVYYAAPYYYRWDGGTWHLSKDMKHWKTASPRGVPPGLAKKHH